MLLSAAVIATALQCIAQANFSVIPVMVDEDVSEEAAKVLYRKTEQILTRNSAGAAGAVDVFAVRAKLTVTDQAKSSGLVREISYVSGEWTLTAVNKVDNSKYYSVTVPLEAVMKGTQNGGPSLALANAIKPTDAVYTRFIRVAREKIDEFYSDHCSEILGRASNLGLSGQYELALTYLTGMPASAPCHDDALELIAGLRTKIDTDKAIAEEKAEAKEEKRREERRKEREDRNSNSVSDGKSRNSDHSDREDLSDYSQDDTLGELYIESPDWRFIVTDAQYIPTSRKIKITASATYIGKKTLSGDCRLGFKKALDQSGDAYDTCYVQGSTWRTFPEDVPVKIVYYIDDVRKNPDTLSFVGLTIDNIKVEIRNLPVSE